MHRPVKTLSFGILLCCLAASPIITTESHGASAKEGTATTIYNATAATTAKVVTATKSAAQLLEEEAISLYEGMKLRRIGLSRKAFQYAWKGYKALLQKRKIYKDQVLSICDFSQSSRKKRFYIINVAEKKVLINTWVAHGRNSGGEYARAFSNAAESHQSSLGFYVTRGTYYGGHGLALKIDGLEENINDMAIARNIVIHGSKYVGADFLRQSRFNGRSYGCPAIPDCDNNKVIEAIKGGSCLFIYHPTKSYLQNSKVLNG